MPMESMGCHHHASIANGLIAHASIAHASIADRCRLWQESLAEVSNLTNAFEL